jgi:hypothetical protein
MRAGACGAAVPRVAARGAAAHPGRPRRQHLRRPTEHNPQPPRGEAARWPHTQPAGRTLPSPTPIRPSALHPSIVAPRPLSIVPSPVGATPFDRCAPFDRCPVPIFALSVPPCTSRTPWPPLRPLTHAGCSAARAPVLPRRRWRGPTGGGTPPGRTPASAGSWRTSASSGW